MGRGLPRSSGRASTLDEDARPVAEPPCVFFFVFRVAETSGTIAIPSWTDE